MRSRLDLQYMLEELIGNTNVYFQPPETVKLHYPAIVYERENIRTTYAPYNGRTAYSVTFITKDPDSEIVNKLAALPLCRFSRHFVYDNFNHDVFSLYW